MFQTVLELYLSMFRDLRLVETRSTRQTHSRPLRLCRNLDHSTTIHVVSTMPSACLLFQQDISGKYPVFSCPAALVCWAWTSQLSASSSVRPCRRESSKVANKLFYWKFGGQGMIGCGATDWLIMILFLQVLWTSIPYNGEGFSFENTMNISKCNWGTCPNTLILPASCETGLTCLSQSETQGFEETSSCLSIAAWSGPTAVCEIYLSVG